MAPNSSEDRAQWRNNLSQCVHMSVHIKAYIVSISKHGRQQGAEQYQTKTFLLIPR